MTLLLLMLFADGPKLPDVLPQAVITPPSLNVVLTWENSPTPGCSNRLYSWTTEATNVLTITTNMVRVTQRADVRTYHTVKAVLNGIESAPSNIIGVPPKHIDVVFAQRDSKDIGVVDSWTNNPTEPMATYRLRIERTEDYRP